MAGTTYYYWIKACNSGGCSSFSASDSGYRQVTPPTTNPFLNPGFEEGQVAWSESSTGGWYLILQNTMTPIAPHGGTWLAWLGGADNETSILSQTITISSSAPYLHFWYYSGSEDVCGYDYFSVGVNGNYFYSETLCQTNSTNGWVQKVLDLSAYIGTGKTVWFCVTTDVSNKSSVLLDDVSMSNSATLSEAPPISLEVYPGAALLGK